MYPTVFNCLQPGTAWKVFKWRVMLTSSALMAEAAYMAGVVECLNHVNSVLRSTSTKVSQQFHFKSFTDFIAE